MSIVRIVSKYKQLLTKRQWNKLILLLFLMVIAGGAETISVSLILPFMDLVMNPSRVRGAWYVLWIQKAFNTDDISFITAVIAMAMAVVYVVKNIYIVWEVRIQQRFVSRSMFETQRQLIHEMINKPYEYFLGESSGRILTYVYNHVANAFALLTQVLYMFSELVVSGMLVVALFVISPAISLLMSVTLFFIMLVISKGIKPIMKRASFDNETSSQQLYKWILQSIQGIKEVKIMRAEDYFVDNYEKAGSIYVNATCTYTVMNNIPRALIEAFLMAGFFSTISVFILRGQNIGNMFPVIAVIAMAAIRLLPAANRISGAMASIAYNEPYIDELLSYINDSVNKVADDHKTIICEEQSQVGHYDEGESNDEISVSNVCYKYPGTKKTVLRGVTFGIKRGETVGIVGESGAGKTTLVDIMMGLLVPDTGSIQINNTDIRNGIMGKDIIGYIPQSIFMMDDSIEMNVAFGINPTEIDRNRVWKALDDAALGEFVRGLPDGIDTQIGERGMRLSGGQRQRIGIARALYRNPEILFFDEATSALDNETEKEIMESINGLKGHKTMIIIAHRLTTIESCDHIYRVENGEIVKER